MLLTSPLSLSSPVSDSTDTAIDLAGRDGRDNMRILKLSHSHFMCINGYWQAWAMLMTSKVESANDMRKVSGSLFSATIVFSVTIQEEKEQKTCFPLGHRF